MSDQPLAIVVLSLVLVSSVGMNCAFVTGFLSWRGGSNPSNAILRAGAAFGATLALGISLLAAFNHLQ
jgi:hypothetical protein